MISYDYKLGDYQADRLAKDDADRAALRESIEITPQELGECLSILTDEQFFQFLQIAIDSSDKDLKHMVRLVCAETIERKVNKIVDSMGMSYNTDISEAWNPN
jgi:hypothetical protein